MLSVTELRSGTTFMENGIIYQVLSYEHIKMGRGSANIKVKVRNLKNGATTEKSFINGAVVEDVNLVKRIDQYLYRDQNQAIFMDPNTYEQISVEIDKLSGYEFLKEGENATLEFYNDEVVSLHLPPKVTLKVTDTPPGVKGDSASNMYKEATLENGMHTKVPLFINIGDSIVVDTRDGSYTKRAS